MFQLTEEELVNLRSQFATFNKDTRKYRPYAFTEHGILMLSSVLNSDRAIDVNLIANQQPRRKQRGMLVLKSGWTRV